MKKSKLLIFLFFLGGIILYYYINPTQYYLMPKCMFKVLTGYNCPACGVQRFIHAFLHGDFANALHYNYFLVYALPYAASFILVWLLPDIKIKYKIKNIIEDKYVVNVYVISFVAWLFIRNYLKI